MNPALLVAAAVTGTLAAVVGLPAWRSWQGRAAIARNAERYLAWRGRGDRPAAGSGEMTTRERRQIAVGVALGVAAVACLVIGLSTS